MLHYDYNRGTARNAVAKYSGPVYSGVTAFCLRRTGYSKSQGRRPPPEREGFHRKGPKLHLQAGCSFGSLKSVYE